MQTYTSPAIILGGGSANGLGIARNLGSQGIPVLCLTSNRWELTRFSRYCAGYAIVPHLETSSAVLQQTLYQLTPHIEGVGVLFPTSDTVLRVVSVLRNTFTAYTTVLPRHDLIELMVVKSQFYQYLQRHAIPHPRIWAFDATTVDEKSLRFPVYLRPVQSLPFAQQFHRKGFIVRRRHDLTRFLTRATTGGHTMMLQELIPGPPRCEYTLRGYLDRHARLHSLVAVQKVRWRTMFTPNAVMRSVPLTQVAPCVDILLPLFHELGYTGLFMAEFKRDPRDGVFKLLEVNARSAGDNHFMLACGVNHILAAYRDALQEPVSPTRAYRTGVYNINLKNDLYLSVHRTLHGTWEPQMLVPYLRPHHWHSVSTKDPLPGIIKMLRS